MIRLTTLGALDLRKGDGTPVQSVLRQPRRYAILAYLALARPRGFHRRDRVLAIFWPEEDQNRARHRLAQAKHYLTRSLGRDVIVNRSDEEIGVDPARLTSDVVEFEAALERDDPEAALALYGAELLAGFHIDDAPEFERWLDEERARLARLAAGAAWKVAERKGAAGDGAGAAAAAKRAVALDPWNEGGLRRLIALLDQRGDRAGAVAVYQDYARRLEADLGTQPAAETVALIETVKRREEAGAVAPPRPVLPTPPPGSTAGVSSEGAGVEAGPRTDERVVATPFPVRSGGSSADDANGPSGEGSGSAGSGATEQSVGLRRRVAGLPVGGRIAAAAIVLLTVAALLRGDSLARLLGNGAAEPPPLRRIAVLPFTDLDPNERDAPLAAALTAELIEQLHDQRMIQVVSYPAIKSWVAGDHDFDALHRELGVSLIVSGRILGSDSTIQVSISLSDASTGGHLDAAGVTVRRGENLVLAESVSKEAELFLRPQLGQEFRLREWQAGTRSDSAWGLLSEADYQFQQAVDLDLISEDWVTVARILDDVDRLIERSRAHDADWVEPLLLKAAVADLHGFVARLQDRSTLNEDYVAEWYDRADSIATNAIDMGAGAAGYETRGWIRHRQFVVASPGKAAADSLLRAAEADLRKAKELEPGRPRTLNTLGNVLLLRGHYPEAKVTMEQALAADVYHADMAEILNRLFVLSFHMGDDDDAGNYCAALQSYLPDTSIAAQCQMLIYGWSDDAPVDGRPALLLFSNFGGKDQPGSRKDAKPWMAMLTAAALVRAGQLADAAAIAEEWRRPAYRENASFLEFEAALLVRLGQVDQARGLVVQLVKKLPRMEARLRQARYFQALFEEGDAWLYEGPRAAAAPRRD